MITEFMNHNSIMAHLESQGLNPIAEQDKSQLIISKKVIRCDAGDTLIAGMGSDKRKDDQIHLVVDAVHLCLQAKGEKITLIFGKRKKKKEQAEVENAVALMIESIKNNLKIEIEVDGNKIDIKGESFNEDPKGKIESWMQYLSRARVIPNFAKELEGAVSDPLFKWYRSVTGKDWSGRVGGLEVCTMDLTGQEGKLNVGSPGKNGDGLARQKFKDIITKENINEGSFFPPQLEKVALVIRAIAESRRNGDLRKVQREHLLESQVLSEEAVIVSKEGILKSVYKDHPFQFPTLWAPSAKPRFVDALMRFGDIPYVVELKEPSGTSPGQGYRHAITQAVLYREFIRRAEKVHDWLKQKGLDPGKCRAMVAFPELHKDKKKQMLLRQHEMVGNAFGVEIVEIKGFK